MSKDAEKFWSYELDQKGRERYLRMADGSDKYADSGWSSMPKPLRSLIGQLMNVRKYGFRFRVEDGDFIDNTIFPTKNDTSDHAKGVWVEIISKIIGLNGGYVSGNQLMFLMMVLKIPKGMLDITKLRSMGYTFKAMGKSIIHVGNDQFSYVKMG